MGGAFQLIEMLLVACVILLIMLFIAFLIGRVFQNKKTRKRIMLGTIALFFIGFVSYFGWIAFILSGNLN